ncbi:MAG: hypothetical protein WC197_07025 [Candidatus Gastranaerophilaceae bacterium]
MFDSSFISKISSNFGANVKSLTNKVSSIDEKIGEPLWGSASGSVGAKGMHKLISASNTGASPLTKDESTIFKS